MNPFSAIWRWWTKPRVARVIDEAAVLAEQAAPIVEDIENNLKPHLKPNRNKTLIESYLGEFEADETLVKQVAGALSKLPIPDMLHGVACFLVARYVPEPSRGLVRLAVELAYQLYVKPKIQGCQHEVEPETKAQG